MNVKKISIVVSAVVILVIAGVVVFLSFFKKNAYRMLKVYQIDGEGTVTRQDIGDIDPYNNMVLETGDTVTLNKGNMVLQADDDKYIYMEEDTQLVLNASGNSENSKTEIELKRGSITNDIQNKLNDDSSYEVNTPNSTMSVRGTIFRVSVYEIDGVKYTKISVFEGKVASYLVYKDGTKSDKEVVVEKGKEVIIYEDDKTTDYLSDPQDIDYSELPESVRNMLGIALEEGRDVAFEDDGDGGSSDPGSDDSGDLGDTVTVTFMYNGSVFGTQTVKKGGTASIPSLEPPTGGSWNWTFSDPVEEDITIEWK